MKKSILLVLPISVLSLFGCKSKDSKMPTIYNEEFRSVIYADASGNKSQFVLTHFNNSPVGYIPLGKIFNNILKQSKIPIDTKYQGHNFILHNKLTNTDCTVDFDKQTITYDNFDKYNIIEEPYVDNINIDKLIATGKNYFLNIDKSKQEYIEPKEGTKRVIEMSNYKIPLYFDQSYGYVPVDIVKTLFAPFLDLTLSYNGTCLYSYSLDNADEKTRKAYFEEGNIFNNEYMEYTYNLLALQLDFNFGLDQRTCRTGTKQVTKFLEGGAYKIIEPYHDRLVSLKPGESDAAYIELFAKHFDDGGHTGYTSHNCLAYENVTESYFGPEAKNTFYVLDRLGVKRKEKKLNPSSIVNQQTGKEVSCDHSFEICTGDNSDIAVLTFDSFTYPKTTFTKESVTKDNYWENTLYTVTYANDQIRNTDAGKKVKHLIIDLSLNKGGKSVAEHYIASWLSQGKGATTRLRNTKDKTYQKMTVNADINRDGKIDENDYLPSDINVYCMVSACSFSCGNLLPLHLKEIRNENTTKIMGDRSGGGSCLVTNIIPTGLGVTYQVSSPYQFGTNTSTSYDNFITNEDGVAADTGFYETGNQYDKDDTIEKFFNRDTIFNKIHEQKNK